MARFNVVVVSDFFFPDSPGGANRYAHQLASGLAKRGHGVKVVTRKARPDLPASQMLDGLEVIRVGAGRPQRLMDAAGAAWGAHRAVKREPGETLFILNQPLTGTGLLWSGPRPYLYVFHSPWHVEYEVRAEEESDLKRDWPVPLFIRVESRRLAELRVIRSARRVVFLSKYMRGLCQSIHEVGPSRPVVIPPWIDSPGFAPPESRDSLKKSLKIPLDRPILFTLRNLRPRMGIENLLGGLALLKNEGCDFRLLVGGDGPMRAELESLSRSLGLGEQVKFLGYIPEASLPGYYGAADLFVLPTRKLEGFGLVILEAFACGTPVLGTPVGAIPEVLGELSPRMVAGGSSPRELAGALGYWFSLIAGSGPGYEEARSSCRSFVTERYGAGPALDRWEALLGEML